MKFPESLPSVYRILKSSWKVAVYTTITCVFTGFQCKTFYMGGKKLVREVGKFEEQLLPWHFMPPGFVTAFILLTIFIIEVVHHFVGDDGTDFEIWLLVTTELDINITCGLFFGGVAVFSGLLFPLHEPSQSLPK
jgi:hypothetical protein